MKYLNIFNETMEKEMEIALKEENKNKKKNRKMSEWAAVYEVLCIQIFILKQLT